MAHITWKEESASVWTAVLNDEPVCTLKTKDIGGCNATWTDGRMWPPPPHLPKAPPQAMRFFTKLDEAKNAVEQVLHDH